MRNLLALNKLVSRIGRAAPHLATVDPVRATAPGKSGKRRAAVDRQRDRSCGPVGRGWYTRKHWSRPRRRAKAKAQRLARRRNRP